MYYLQRLCSLTSGSFLVTFIYILWKYPFKVAVMTWALTFLVCSKFSIFGSFGFLIQSFIEAWDLYWESCMIFCLRFYCIEEKIMTLFPSLGNFLGHACSFTFRRYRRQLIPLQAKIKLILRKRKGCQKIILSWKYYPRRISFPERPIFIL